MTEPLTVADVSFPRDDRLVSWHGVETEETAQGNTHAGRQHELGGTGDDTQLNVHYKRQSEGSNKNTDLPLQNQHAASRQGSSRHAAPLSASTI